MAKISDTHHVTKTGTVKKNPVKYNTIFKKEYLPKIPNIMNPDVKKEADRIFGEINKDYEEPFEITRNNVVYKYKGDIFTNNVIMIVNSEIKNSKYKILVNEYVYAKLVREGFYIHTWGINNETNQHR